MATAQSAIVDLAGPETIDLTSSQSVSSVCTDELELILDKYTPSSRKMPIEITIDSSSSEDSSEDSSLGVGNLESPDDSKTGCHPFVAVRTSIIRSHIMPIDITTSQLHYSIQYVVEY